MDPEEEDEDDEESEEDSIDYPTSRGDDANDDGDELSDDDADDEGEKLSSDREEEEEEHLALTVSALALHSSISAFEESDETESFEEGKTAATPPPFGYRVAARISVQPPLFLMPLPIFTPLPTSSFPLPLSIPSTSGSESVPEADIPLRKRARFTTPTSRYEIERRYFHTLATTYAQEVAHSRDYCTQIMDYCQSREVHTRTLMTQIKALQRDVSTLQRQHIDDEDRLTMHIQHEHAQRDVAPEDGDSCS
nr:hypothetical protein [Tanacetum cinerariifolium]